jgi:arginyl-tRNA synthetase
MQRVKDAIERICHELFGITTDAAVSRPDEQFGDFASNVALSLAGRLQRSPKDIAEEIATALRKDPFFVAVSVAGPGFINVTISDAEYITLLNQVLSQKETYGSNDIYKDKVVLVEYLDPNPFKELHIGHAYSGTIGDAIASLFTTAGGLVHRVTYQGDVGLHVAKALWAIQRKLDNDPEKLRLIPEQERVRFLGESYAEGATAYEQDEPSKIAIDDLNKEVYALTDPVLREFYETGKAWSLSYFTEVYELLKFTPFEKNYMERDVAGPGKELVENHLADRVFEESNGAVVFKGEKYGMHTRVFINAKGLPTYEAKDLGNAMRKYEDYHYDRSIIITAEEQTQYFRVMLKALEQFEPLVANATQHVAHGVVKLSTGKMSSRTGKVLRAIDVYEAVLDEARELAKQSPDAPIEENAIGALKYMFLKNRIGGDIICDLKESVSMQGNSGPYIQYAHARAQSILAKYGELHFEQTISDLDGPERILVKKITEYSEVIARSIEELLPHHICTYLYELAQVFNRFYEHNRVIGDQRQQVRLLIVAAYAQILRNGLTVLNIPAPNRM